MGGVAEDVHVEERIDERGRVAEDPDAEAHHAVKGGGTEFANAFLVGAGVIDVGFLGVLGVAERKGGGVECEDGGSEGDERGFGGLVRKAEAEGVEGVELLNVGAGGKRLAATREQGFIKRAAVGGGAADDAVPFIERAVGVRIRLAGQTAELVFKGKRRADLAGFGVGEQNLDGIPSGIHGDEQVAGGDEFYVGDGFAEDARHHVGEDFAH